MIDNDLQFNSKQEEAQLEKLDVIAVQETLINANMPETIDDEESLSDKVKVLSPLQLVLKRFFRSKLSVAGLAMILFLFAFSFLGPFFGGIYGVPIYSELHRMSTPDDYYTMLFFYRRYLCVDTGNTYTFFYTTFTRQQYKQLFQPDSYNILGTDQLGHDIFSRLMYGGRISLGIAFLVVFISTFIGVIFGALAGYFGKWVDQIIMRLVDLFMCIPTLPILLVISAMLDARNVNPTLRIWLIMVMLTVFGWAGIARLVRGQILMLREQDYMLAAESMGLSAPRRIFRHLIPNVMPQLIVSMTLGLGGVILSEATLSYLGFGVQSPYAAWGTMIGGLRYFHILQNHFHLWGPPGILIMIAVLGFNFIGDGLRDAFDPKMKR